MANIDITKWIIPIVAVAVYVICEVVKSTKLIDNTRWIPGLAIVLGIVFSFWNSESVSFLAFVQGLASGWCAIGIHETAKAVKGE